MNRTDSYFRRNPNGSSLRRFSFRRKPTRESIPIPTSTWVYNDHEQEWKLLRGNPIFGCVTSLDNFYKQFEKDLLSCRDFFSILFFLHRSLLCS